MIIHADASEDGFGAYHATVCKRGRPNARGTNLTLADNHVTCEDCLRELGYAAKAKAA